MAIIEGEIFTQYGIHSLSPSSLGDTWILNGWYHDSRSEILISADEMFTLGFPPGESANITELKFYQNTIPTEISNVTVAMSHTMDSVLSGNTFTPFDTMTKVMENATFSSTMTPGWIRFIFDTPFQWDGVANILVTLIKDRPAYDDASTVHVRDTVSNAFYKGYRDDSAQTTEFPFEVLTQGGTTTYTMIPRTYLVADTSPIVPTTVAPNLPVIINPVNGYLSSNKLVSFTATLIDNEDISINDNVRLVVETGTNGSSFPNSYTSPSVTSGNNATVNVTFSSNGTYFWRAKAVDKSGLVSGYTSVRTIIIDNLPPKLTNISPNANTTVSSSSITISATATDSDSISSVEYEIYRDLAMTTRIFNGSLNWISGDNYSITVSGASITQGNYYWRIRANDNNGERTAWTNLRGIFVNIATTGRLSPDSVLATNNITVTPSVVSDDPDSPDTTFATIPNNTLTMNARFSFPSPPKNLRTGAGLQEFRVLTRKSLTSSTSNPTLTISLYESGSTKATGSPFTVTTMTNTGQVASFTWDASLLTAVSGQNVEVYVSGTMVGSGGSRTTTNIGAIEWNYNTIAETQTNSPTDSTPAIVTSLSATPSDTSVYLSWTNPSDADLYCTEVYRNDVLIYTLSPSITSLTDAGLSSGTTYTYKFITVDVVGGKSSPVTINSTTTNPTPLAPSVNIVSVDKYKISAVSGANLSHIVFTFDRDVTQWECRVGGTGQGTGFLADSGGAVTVGNQITATIDRTELSSEGQNKVNIYGLNDVGWTQYQ